MYCNLGLSFCWTLPLTYPSLGLPLILPLYPTYPSLMYLTYPSPSAPLIHPSAAHLSFPLRPLPQEEEEGEEREKMRQSETYTVTPATMQHRLTGLLDRVDEVSGSYIGIL